MNRIIAGFAVAVAVIFAGCGSNADTVSKNLSKEAEKFGIVRSIVGVNGITDKVVFEVTGRCSVEGNGLGSLPALEAICKDTVDGKTSYKKHYITIPDNVTVVVTQKEGIDVSEYRTKIILRPEALVPDFDLVTGTAIGTTP